MASKESISSVSSSRRGSDGRVVDTEEVEHVLQSTRVKTNEELMSENIDKEWQRKASFDRFGDDLTELIVSYLPIEEKFRLECLSKQWQRLVFNKQYVLRIQSNDKTFSDKLLCKVFKNYQIVKFVEFEKCLKKLKNLTDIVIMDYQVYGQNLELIADNCHHLRRLDVRFVSFISDKSIIYFGRKCGQNLKHLKVYNWSSEKIQLLLLFTGELTSLEVITEIESDFDSKLLFDSEYKLALLPKLRELKINFKSLSEDLENFAFYYSSRLQVLKVSDISSYDCNALIYLIQSLEDFEELQSLEIKYDRDEMILTDEDIKIVGEVFIQMADNSRQLKRLSIDLCLSDKTIILQSLGSFSQLTDLELLCVELEDNDNCFVYLKQLTQLKRLKIWFYSSSDNGLENIGKYLPQLKSLSVRMCAGMSDRSLEYISELKRLKSLEIEYQPESEELMITSEGVKPLLQDLANISSLVINQLDFDDMYAKPIIPFISEVIEILKLRAKQKSKIHYYFGTNADMSDPTVAKSLEELPPNMTFKANLSIKQYVL